MRDTVPASTSLLMASRGAMFDITLPRLDFHAGTAALSLSAGLDSTNLRALGSLRDRTALSITTPPNEWPTGTTSAADWVSTWRTKAAVSSIHWDHESTWPRCPALSP